MSVFSEHLNALIQKKSLTLSYLEKESGLSIALISKIKTGKRLPESEEKAIKLLRALHCSAEKEKELLKEYRIERIGREKYLYMEEIRKMLNSLSHYSSPINIYGTTEFKFEKNQIVSGENNIKTLIHYLLETETSNNCAVLKILLQPKFSFLEDCLVLAVSNKNMSNLHLEHIISLRELNDYLSNCENLKLANSCLRLASIYKSHYQAFYSYKAELPTDFFPYCVLTSQYGLLISADYQNALLIWETATLNVLNRMFDSIKQGCHPFIHTTDGVNGFLQAYAENLQNSDTSDDYTVGISCVPCIMTSISPELAMRRINPELKKNSYVMNFLKFYFTNQRAAKDITIFSMDGLKLFMQTGLCYELPEGCCDAFSIEERIAIMDSFMQKAETGQLIPILVRDEQLKLSPELVITVYNFRNPIFMWHLPEIPFSSCYIQEAGIQNSIMDFLIYIQNAEDITYSRQESLAILKEYMNNHFQY